jgi:hypothetical protein
MWRWKYLEFESLFFKRAGKSLATQCENTTRSVRSHNEKNGSKTKISIIKSLTVRPGVEILKHREKVDKYTGQISTVEPETISQNP